MTSRTRAKRAFVSAIVLLGICGSATYLSFSYLRASERWIAHSQEVRAAIGDVESSISAAARARMNFLITGSDAELTAYRNAVSRIPQEMARLRVLTRDNKAQLDNCNQLETVTNARLKDWEAAVAAKKQGQQVDLINLMQQSISLSAQSAQVGEAIRAEELRLLLQRTLVASGNFFLPARLWSLVLPLPYCFSICITVCWVVSFMPVKKPRNSRTALMNGKRPCGGSRNAFVCLWRQCRIMRFTYWTLKVM